VRRSLTPAGYAGAIVGVIAVAVVVYYFAYFEVPREAVRDDLAAAPAPSPAATATPTPTATATPVTAHEHGTLVNQARTAAVQAIGGLVLALGAILTVRSLRLTRQAQITERFTAAVGNLGSEIVSVRVAAIHALGRIARDSRADHTAVMAILGSHLRQWCGWPAGDERPEGASEKPEHAPYPEVHAAAFVLRQRRTGRDRDGGELDLSLIDWRDAPLSGARLQGAQFVDANLAGAHLNGTDLRGASLVRAGLEGASLLGADLRRTELKYARFSDAVAEAADLRDALSPETADFDRTFLYGAKLPPGARTENAIFRPRESVARGE